MEKWTPPLPRFLDMSVILQGLLRLEFPQECIVLILGQLAKRGRGRKPSVLMRLQEWEEERVQKVH